MALKILRNNTEFRIESQEFITEWLPDTRANRKVMLVSLRLLCDANGKALYTHEELAAIVGSDKRQASSGHVELFRDGGLDFKNFILHQRKVNDEVVDALCSELKRDPLATVIALKERVNQNLKRSDISDVNIRTAMEQISVNQIRQPLLKQLSSGEAHYKEEYLLSEMMQHCQINPAVEMESVEAQGMSLSDPTAIRKLLTPNTEITEIDSPIKWVSFSMALYYHGVSLSVLGKWMKVHKTTILRWIISLAICLWPIVSGWLSKEVKAKLVYIDEKWIKIKGKWYYWFVVLDKETQLPILTSLLASRSKFSVRWLAVKLKQLGQVPSFIITDGLKSYQHFHGKVKRVLCLFHHQQGVTRWLKEHFSDKEQIEARKKEMKKLFQTNDKRTVKRRLSKLKEKQEQLQIQEWVKKTEQDLPQLLPSVGSHRIPKTNNAMERFFRAFNRFYKARNGFFSVISAKRELIFFLLMYLFIQQPTSGKAPLEAIMPEVREMPFYQLVNDPLAILIGSEKVNQKVKMADFQPNKALQTQIQT